MRASSGDRRASGLVSFALAVLLAGLARTGASSRAGPASQACAARLSDGIGGGVRVAFSPAATLTHTQACGAVRGLDDPVVTALRSTMRVCSATADGDSFAHIPPPYVPNAVERLEPGYVPARQASVA